MRRQPVQVIARKRRDRAGERQRAREKRKAKLEDARNEIELVKLHKELARAQSGEPDHDNLVAQLRVSDLAGLNKALASAGLEVRRIDGADDDGNSIKGIAKSFGAGAAAVLFPNGIQGGLNPGFVQGAQAATATAPALPPGNVVPQVPPGDNNLEQAIRDIVQLTPDEAAAWLRSQTSPYAKQIVRAILDTPNERLPELVAQMGQFSPMAPVLLSGRIPWLLEVKQRLQMAAFNQQNLPVNGSPL